MKRFSNILFIADLTVDDAGPFDQAINLAKNNQAKLTVVAIVDGLDLAPVVTPGITSELLEAMVDEKREHLRALVQSKSIAGSAIEIKVLVGKAFVEIIREVLRYKRDLIITTAEKSRGIGSKLIGGTQLKLLRKCPCPVWLIKSTQQQGFREIVVALDYDPDNPELEPLNRQILEMATALSLADFSELHIVHAWHLPHENVLRGGRMGNTEAEVDALLEEEENIRRRWLTDLIEQCCAVYGKDAASYLKPQLRLIKGNARTIVPEYAQELGAELVVMGTVGRAGISGFLIGNTAEAILDQIDCSVLAIKPAGFISPVTLEKSV